MPVRRRVRRNRAGLDTWRTWLTEGWDPIWELYSAGIPVPPPREMALEAWLRFRDQLREEWNAEGNGRRMWAETEFEDADKTTTPKAP